MQKIFALLVIVAVSSSLQKPAGSETQFELTIGGEAETRINYLIPNFVANWHKSVEYCNYLGRRLAIIDSKVKEAELYQAIKDSDIFSNRSSLVWIGASDLADEGNFHWHGTGRRVVYSNWAHRQPDNAGSLEHCVEVGLHVYPLLSMNWQWNDRDCNVNRYFACE